MGGFLLLVWAVGGVAATAVAQGSGPHAGIPAPIRADLERAFRLYQQGDLAGAETIYRDLTVRHPGVVQGWFGLGVVREGRGDLEGAAAAFEAVVRLEPTLAGGHNNLGWIRLRQGRAMPAMDHCMQALRAEPGDKRAAVNLGLALLQLGEADVALATFAAVEKRFPGDEGVLIGKGLAYQSLRRDGFAEAAWREALRSNPRSVAARVNLANLMLGRGRDAEAQRLLDEAHAMAPRSSTVANSIGYARLRAGDAAGAVQAWKEALALDPANRLAADNLGRLHLDAAARDSGEARRIYEAMAATWPDDPRVLANLGAARLLSGDAAGALHAYEAARTRAPQYAAAVLGSGMALESLGRYDEAYDRYFHAAELAPDWATARYRLARAYARQGLPREAFAELRRAVDLDETVKDEAAGDPAWAGLRDQAGFREAVRRK